MQSKFYDYAKFWVEDGTKPLPPLNGDHHSHQKYLLEELERLQPKSILDVGAGWGRATGWILEKFPDIEYVALDLSLNRLTLLAQQYPRAGIHYGDFFSYTGKKHDVVMALEVTMHIPPTLVDSFCKKMIASASKAVITIDYYPAQERDVQLLEFNFLHDYPKLLQRPKRTQVNYVQSMFVKKLRG